MFLVEPTDVALKLNTGLFKISILFLDTLRKSTNMSWLGLSYLYFSIDYVNRPYYNIF